MISCKKEIMLTGAQPSNNLHIGNYFGLIKNCVEYQDKYDLYIFVADLHALSAAKPDYKNLYENKINLVASYIASGIDFKKTTVFFQSDVYTHTNLM
jgi:tryptophanyl-tRNA synthetase